MSMIKLTRSRVRRRLVVAGPALVPLAILLALAVEARAQTVHFETLNRSVIEARLRESPRENADREAALEKLFEQSGCTGANLSRQPVIHERLPNVVCTLPGTTGSIIMVGAHFDHVARGTGIIDNWSGASLLPSLLESLRHEPRKHTFIFVGFTAEEEGLVGSTFYARQMTPEQVARTRAVVNLDSLALGPTKLWLNHSDPRLATALATVAGSMKLPIAVVNADQFGDDDSEPFLKSKIPTLMIHSVTQGTMHILHTSDDSWKAVKLDDYYDTYRLLATYLAYIDTLLD